MVVNPIPIASAQAPVLAILPAENDTSESVGQEHNPTEAAHDETIKPIVSKDNSNQHSESQKINKTYCQTRMDELGITAVMNTVMVEYDCFDSMVPMAEKIFRPNAQDSIEILYIGLNGMKTYQKGRKELPYRRIRLNPTHCQKAGMPRYLTPKGAGTEVFFPPQVLDAYHRQDQIKTLYITEGEFKAMKASLHRLYCVGVQGIHNFTEKDGLGNRILNTELEALIKTCAVKNVVLLLDNDCLTVTYEPDKDLFTRPNLFYSAVRNFREATKHLDKVDVYFQHLNPDQVMKGIDDLLVSMPGQESKIVADVLAITKPVGKYVYTQNMTEKGLKVLKSYFHITSADEFYAEYQEKLGSLKFRYQGCFYQHNGTVLKNLISDQVTMYIRVGDEYFEHIQKPDRLGHLVPQYAKRVKSTITDDFGKGAIEHIAKYKAFALVPSHSNFKQVIEGCYNAYHKLTHLPLPGSIEHSLAMVRHIFKDNYEFGLDYLQLLYLQPGQLLPIILLQSKERNTGKSTLGQWLIYIFQANATKLGNADLENDFNSTYAERLVIVVDETSVSKRVTSEAIKRMSTEQGKIFVNAKNRQQYETEWIGKFVFITNTIDKALYIGKGEMRYFVRTVNQLPGSDDPDMLEKLREEIPAFLYFLERRALHHARKGRMFFDFADYQTPELAGAIEANKSVTEQEIRRLIEDTFEAFVDLAELQFAPGDIAAELKDTTRYRISDADVRASLKNDFGLLATEKSARYAYHSLRAFNAGVSTELATIPNKVGRIYTFMRTDFIP
ncbi:MAG: hypothetical protein JWP57_4309 [Spirosoma sp.]|nr:hypothetical protein [Spirosoma sp.]